MPDAAGQAKDAEAAQRKLADENFRQARKAVDDFFTGVSQNRLLNEPGLQPLRKELLESALKYYQGFLQSRRDDPGVQVEQARTLFRVAQITDLIGSPEAAWAR